MPSIRKRTEKKFVGYQTLVEYRDDWYLLFDNAREVSEPDSVDYLNANALQTIIDSILITHAEADHSLPGALELLGGASSATVSMLLKTDLSIQSMSRPCLRV